MLVYVTLRFVHYLDCSGLWLQVERQIFDLFEDLRDGNHLISLLEVLSQENLVSVSRISTTLQVQPQLVFFLVVFAAARTRPHAIPQTAERQHRPRLPQDPRGECLPLEL